jgi:hypothetical protein
MRHLRLLVIRCSCPQARVPWIHRLLRQVDVTGELRRQPQPSTLNPHRQVAAATDQARQTNSAGAVCRPLILVRPCAQGTQFATKLIET